MIPHLPHSKQLHQQFQSIFDISRSTISPRQQLIVVHQPYIRTMGGYEQEGKESKSDGPLEVYDLSLSLWVVTQVLC